MSTPSLTRLQNVPEVLAWLRQQGVRALTVDSRELPGRVAQGQAVGFIAWPGAARDGRAFVTQALQQGARAALVEADGVDAFAFADERVAAVSGLKATLAIIAHEFHGRPSEHLEVLAVTGTNGKTSTSWWTAQALSALGRPCGVIGTLGVGRPGGGDFEPTGLTTPDPVTLHATFRQFLDHGLQAAAIEASSIGIEERRLDATRIAVAQFTNFTQDHLDYHGTMEAYWQAKAALFNWPGLRAAVVNADDPQAPELVALADQRALDL
ncbi:MAG TPA: Mur ligase family protein, partial [Aquabacterium sp.]|nr:Mur ligase family protein [Aquabacterium sp.]